MPPSDVLAQQTPILLFSSDDDLADDNPNALCSYIKTSLGLDQGQKLGEIEMEIQLRKG
jgi:benzoyl-CoA reductase/2-hydroxyglutaryl-CoA dehydratase subunit BcrC/BadD/HgdB